MKRGPLAWVHAAENHFLISEQRAGVFVVVPLYAHEQLKIAGEIFRTRSEGTYWRNKYNEIYKAGFVAGMAYISKQADKNQTDLFGEIGK